MNDCVFCKIFSREVKERIIYENRNFFSIFDINPVAEGHSLVVSKKHFNNILDMPESLALEAFDCIKKTAVKIMKDKNAEDFNLLVNNSKAAGQAIPHAHFHIIPRRKGDNVRLN